MFNFSRAPQPGQLTDEALLARYRSSGDAHYLGVLYERYMPMVYGVCLKTLGNAAQAEDAVMSIYEELARKALEHEVESFRGWLYVLARNFCLMELRKKQRHPIDYHAPENMARYDAVEAAFEVETSRDSGKPLEKCLGELPQHQRRSVEMFYFEDKSYKDIALLLTEDVGKVRSFIQNGRRNLRLCLEKAGITSP